MYRVRPLGLGLLMVGLMAAPLWCCCIVAAGAVAEVVAVVEPANCHSHADAAEPADAPATPSPDDGCDCREQCWQLSLAQDAGWVAATLSPLPVVAWDRRPVEIVSVSRALEGLLSSRAPPLPLTGRERCARHGILVI